MGRWKRDMARLGRTGKTFEEPKYPYVCADCLACEPEPCSPTCECWDCGEIYRRIEEQFDESEDFFCCCQCGCDAPMESDEEQCQDCVDSFCEPQWAKALRSVSKSQGEGR